LQFKNIIGQKDLKQKLRKSVSETRVAHTQLFLGVEGSGALPLAIAFAQYLNCKNKENDDSCGECHSCVKYQKFSHPDLHFVFPTVTSDRIKEPKSDLYIKEWRNYLKKSGAYVAQSEWYEILGMTGLKQGTIYSRDATDITTKLNVKSYESEYTVVIIYLAERLQLSASNKLLKIFEEPPNKTLILMIAERYELILPTVRSRAQLIRIPQLKDKVIVQSLKENTEVTLSEKKLSQIAALSNGNWNKALQLIDDQSDSQFNFLKFREWMRLCFVPSNYVKLMSLTQELARLPREKQKKFLAYGLNVVHNTLLANSNLDNKIRAMQEEADYFKKFSPYINLANSNQVYELFNNAIYHLERNANAGILFGDLSMQMIELLIKGKKFATVEKKR